MGKVNCQFFVGHVQISPFTVCVDVMGLNEHLDKKLCGLFRQVSIGYKVTSSKHANFRPCVGLCYVILTSVFCLINSVKVA